MGKPVFLSKVSLKWFVGELKTYSEIPTQEFELLACVSVMVSQLLSVGHTRGNVKLLLRLDVVELV
jgi:hypothetical protein